MGIFIHLEVSKSVTEEEWDRVYEESLELVKAFPLAERGTISYAGQQLMCAVRTKERLYRRIQQLPIEENDKMKVFEHFFLGEKDKTFYDFMQNHFHADVIQTYWENRFADSRIGTRGFVKDLKEYLLSGAGLEKLCSIVCMEDQEGKPQYEKFIYAIMDCKLYIKQKNIEDYLDIQQQEEQPYSIWTLMADFAYGSAHNRKVDRYVPIGEIRQALRSGIGDKCDTDQYIDQYLEKEAAAPEINVYKENISEEELEKMADADAAEVFTQLMNKKTEEMQNRRKQYDNLEYDDLLNCKKVVRLLRH